MAKYNYDQCLKIMKIYIDTIDERIPSESAEKEILTIANDYPIHNFQQYLKRTKKYLSGRGEYGFSFPANWAKAFLEATNNNPAVINALKEQQALYLKKDGKCNGKLQELLCNF